MTSGAVIGVGRIQIDPNNKNIAYVAYTGFGTPAAPIAHIYKITNLNNLPLGNVTFTPISTGLPDVPHNAIAIDPMSAANGASTDIYVGTDNGVYNSRDGGATWFPYGTGFPHVSVFGLEIQSPSRILRAATHGRGMYETPVALQPNLPQISTVVSRKKHGAVEPPFDINLPVQGPVGIECRTGVNAGEHTLVFKFTKDIASVASADVTIGEGEVNPATTGPGPGLNEYTVNLVGVTNAQTAIVTLNGVQPVTGETANNVQAAVGFLHGDVNADRRVDSGDTLLVRQQNLQPVVGSNFRADVLATGRIDSGDVLVTRRQNLSELPSNQPAAESKDRTTAKARR